LFAALVENTREPTLSWVVLAPVLAAGTSQKEAPGGASTWIERPVDVLNSVTAWTVAVLFVTRNVRVGTTNAS
jgi:hypothetical protein